MFEKNKGAKTLLWSIVMSAPGPLIVGLGLIAGRSSTQIADFIRRCVEFLAIVLSFVVYCMTVKGDVVDECKKERYEKSTNIFVSAAMVLCGIIMIVLAITSSESDKGNVLPSLIIAVLSVSANSIFWRKYNKLGTETNNKILLAQSNLYRAKTFVDSSVVVTFIVMLLSKDTTIAHYFDLVGTVCVSIYLMFSGTKSLKTELKQ